MQNFEEEGLFLSLSFCFLHTFFLFRKKKEPVLRKKNKNIVSFRKGFLFKRKGLC